MGLFNFFNSKDKSFSNTFTNRYYTSSFSLNDLSSQTGYNAKILAMTKNKKLIYSNIYDESFYVDEQDGYFLFTGPVYMIELNLTNGDQFEIFYGFVTDDRQGITSYLNPSVLDQFCLLVLKEINDKCPSLIDFHYYLSAPTYYTFYFRKTSKYYYITNNKGDVSFLINLDGSRVIRGDRSLVLSSM